ncbi:MAG: hypothetical protein ACETVY_02860 [Candidatus Bathyarchaeia archaeon]
MRYNKTNLVLYILTILCIFIPPLSSVPFDPRETPRVVFEVLSKTAGAYTWLSPLVHVATLTLLYLLYRDGERYGRMVAAFFGALFTFFAFGQNIAVTEDYGLVVITSNLTITLIVGIFWLMEALRPRNSYVFSRLPLWRYWVVPFSILAFWFPLGSDLGPDFNPLLLLTSDFGVTVCPTAPVAIALLTLVYPDVNARLLAVTSLVGFMLGLFNVMSLVVMPGYTTWLLVLHMPLILISFYGLAMPFLIKGTHTSELKI